MTYFPRVRPVLHIADWCGIVLAAFLLALVGAMAGMWAAA